MEEHGRERRRVIKPFFLTKLSMFVKGFFKILYTTLLFTISNNEWQFEEADLHQMNKSPVVADS